MLSARKAIASHPHWEDFWEPKKEMRRSEERGQERDFRLDPAGPCGRGRLKVCTHVSFSGIWLLLSFFFFYFFISSVDRGSVLNDG